MNATNIAPRFCTPLDGLVEAKFQRDQLRDQLLLTLKAIADRLPPAVREQLAADEEATAHLAAAAAEYQATQAAER